jgi:predicted HTH transcriptional regulator
VAGAIEEGVEDDMPMGDGEIRDLVTNPTEKLGIEMKEWFDPSTPEGKAKIIKTCIAMRNNNGGYLVVGFDNDTGVPNVAAAQANARTTFHSDAVHMLVSRHASEPFEVQLHYPEISGREFPVLEVEAGVRTPVATRRPLSDDAGNKLVKENTVYVRSLTATFISTEPRPGNRSG